MKIALWALGLHHRGPEKWRRMEGILGVSIKANDELVAAESELVPGSGEMPQCERASL